MRFHYTLTPTFNKNDIQMIQLSSTTYNNFRSSRWNTDEINRSHPFLLQQLTDTHREK